jgi:hypothetical protein
MGSKGYMLWVMGQLDSNVQSFTSWLKSWNSSVMQRYKLN